MTFKIPGFFLALMAGAAVHAACPPLLEAVSADGAQRLALDRCEVTVTRAGAASRGQVLLTLKEPAAQRWREALKPEAPLWRAMLVAAANVRGDGLSVAPGVLLESHSARLLAQPTWLWDARAATLLLVVRPTAAAAPADGTAPLAPAAVDCAAYPAGRVIFWFAEREVQPGEVLAAQPMYVRAPHDFQPVPPPCVDGWGLSPGAPALLDPASGIGAVAQDAPDGATFNLMAQVGAQTVQGQVRVVDPARHPLKGVWRQVGEIACGGSAQRVPARPLRELRFTGSNIFTATWTPFESYVDYSGTFSFDVPGKDLVLSITGGNDVPAQTQARLRATFDSEGALIVSALPGGTRNPRDPAVCEMVFERR